MKVSNKNSNLNNSNINDGENFKEFLTQFKIL